jgi:hypothetical protein
MASSLWSELRARDPNPTAMLRPESIKRVSDTPETRALPPAISAPPLKASKVPTLFNNTVR